MNKYTVQSLRQSGNKVRVIHRFYDATKDHEFFNPQNLSNDGQPNVTQIDVTMADGKEASGFSYRCKGDQYHRKLGNDIALGRAMKKIGKM